MSAIIRVVIPFHLCTLAGAGPEVQVSVDGTVTVATVLSALEAKYPVLKGTIRDHVSFKRRPFVRFFADNKDISLLATDLPLSEAVCTGKEPLLVIGAIAGG